MENLHVGLTNDDRIKALKGTLGTHESFANSRDQWATEKLQIL